MTITSASARCSRVTTHCNKGTPSMGSAALSRPMRRLPPPLRGIGVRLHCDEAFDTIIRRAADWHKQKLADRGEGAVRRAIGDDAQGNRGAQAKLVLEIIGASQIDIDFAAQRNWNLLAHTREVDQLPVNQTPRQIDARHVGVRQQSACRRDEIVDSRVFWQRIVAWRCNSAQGIHLNGRVGADPWPRDDQLRGRLPKGRCPPAEDDQQVDRYPCEQEYRQQRSPHHKEARLHDARQPRLHRSHLLLAVLYVFTVYTT